MKGFILLMAFIANTVIAFSQDKPVFPNDYIGKWKGTLEWFRAGNPQPQQVNMELYILPSKDTAGQYSWHLIYGSVTQDSRPYLLKSVDSAKIHWVIDELNGIVLDQYWIGNRFIGSFTVGNSTIVNSYYLANGNMIVEFISYQAKPLVKTGKGTEDSPFVDSYATRGFQRAVLKKQ
jgi:hypothetical protein